MGKRNLDYTVSCKINRWAYETLQALAASKGMNIQKYLRIMCVKHCNKEIERIKQHGMDRNIKNR